MADYLAIARRVWCCFTFEHNSFWLSYKPPGMGFISAPFVGPFEGETGLWIWRIASTVFLGGSAFWLSRELSKLFNSERLGMLFLLVVALSRSSIFWSYRFSTESLSESLTYLVLAAFLRFMARGPARSGLQALLLGCASITLALVRPNMVPYLALIPLGLGLEWLRVRSVSFGRLAFLGAAFSIGVMVLWSPWLLRGYRLYGKPVPFSTQGPYSFLWEADGFIYVDPELGERNVNVDMLQVEAPKRFKTDAEAAQLASLAGKQWLEQRGYYNFAWLVAERIKKMIDIRGITLAKTQRDILFADSRDVPLIDKSEPVFLAALLGALLGSVVFGVVFFTLAAMIFSPIILSACFMGEPRMLEPLIPLLVYLVLVAAFSAYTLASRRKVTAAQ